MAVPQSAIMTVRVAAPIRPRGISRIRPKAAARKTCARRVATACSTASPQIDLLPSRDRKEAVRAALAKLLRLGDDTKIGPGGLPAAGELLLRILVGNRRNDDHIVAWLPVH